MPSGSCATKFKRSLSTPPHNRNGATCQDERNLGNNVLDSPKGRGAGDLYLPIADAYSFSTDLNKNMAIVLKGYYDGSGGGKNDDWTTLAGYVASVEVWKSFEDSWQEALHSFEIPCDYLHMKEAWHCRKGFDPKKGWTRAKVLALLRTLAPCFLVNGWLVKEEGSALFGTCCTINHEDFDRACEALPFLKKKGKEAICAEVVTEVALRRLPQDPSREEGYRVGTVSLFFDRKEKFLHPISQEWKKALKRPKGKRGPLSMVTAITPVNEGFKGSPALQAADYLAWHVNRWLTASKKEPPEDSIQSQYAHWKVKLAGGPVRLHRLDYEGLVSRYTGGER